MMVDLGAPPPEPSRPGGPHCPGADVWFDRGLCPDPCNTMHFRCTKCGAIDDDFCAHHAANTRHFLEIEFSATEYADVCYAARRMGQDTAAWARLVLAGYAAGFTGRTP